MIRQRYILWFFMVLCWFIEAMSYRHTVVPDTINYLDLARFVMRGDWKPLINGYWSPGYPTLLGILLFVFHGALPEIISAHIANCLVLMGALICFEYFLSGALGYAAKYSPVVDDETMGLSAKQMRIVGYVLFFWLSLYATPPSLDTPDGLVFVAVLLAAGILVRITHSDHQWPRFAALGAVLGLGYLAKAILFMWSFALIAVALHNVRRYRQGQKGIILTVLVFALLSGPFIFLLSESKSEFTYGDVGKISYAEFVDGVSLYAFWQGEPPGSGTPVHPPEKLLDDPAVWEFSSPLKGTIASNIDQSYWYQGVRPHFDLKGQFTALWHGLDQYFDLFVDLSGLVGAFLLLVIFSRRLVDLWQNFLTFYMLLIPSLFAMGLYALVHVDLRFLPGFVILLWAALFSSLRLPKSPAGQAMAKAGVLVIVLLLGAQIGWKMGHVFFHALSKQEFKAPDIAKKLKDVGVEPGDRLACIACAADDMYWAHLAEVRIDEVMPADSLPSLLAASPDKKAAALSALGRTGARVIIARDLPRELANQGWVQIGDTPYSLFILRR